MRNANQDLLRQLERRLDEYREHEKRAEEDFHRAEEALEKATEELELAENFYAQESRRYGVGVKEPIKAVELRFRGLSPQEACLAALGETDRLSRADLARVLPEGGFSFRTSTPGREIHGALMPVIRAGEVRREGDVYQLV